MVAAAARRTWGSTSCMPPAQLHNLTSNATQRFTCPHPSLGPRVWPAAYQAQPWTRSCCMCTACSSPALQPVQIPGTRCHASPELHCQTLHHNLCNTSTSSKASCTVALSPALHALHAGSASAARPAAQPALHPPGTAPQQCLTCPWPTREPQATASARPGRAPWQGAKACRHGAAAPQRHLQRSAPLQWRLLGPLDPEWKSHV